MELSNKALAVLLLAAVVVSLGGTIISLNRMNSIETVGFATTGTGIVNLSITSTLSITTNESSLVNFGACTLNESRPINLTSMDTEDTPQYCTGTDNLPNNISVRNDGNVNVNVTIATSNCSPGVGNISCGFLNNTNTPAANNGLFQYNVTNYGRYGYTGGCGTTNGSSVGAAGWSTFNGTTAVHACTNLASAPLANSFVTDFRLRVPAGLPIGVQIATITFTAS
jgi:hypothetical protein